MLPTAMRIGYRDYKVEHWPVREAHAAGRLGECDQLNAVIRVSDERTGWDAAETLFHELLHAIFHVGDIEAGIEDGGERIISKISPMFIAAWRDNPDFRKCLNEVDSPFRRAIEYRRPAGPLPAETEMAETAEQMDPWSQGWG